MAWKPPKIWDGGDVWIIGGGPSIITQFEIPQVVVDSVLEDKRDLSVYSPYMKVLHTKHVIGINVAYKIGSWIDFCFFGDKNFLLMHKQALMDFKGISVCSVAYAERYNWIKYMPHSKIVRGISTEQGKVSWNLNSGAASISLAVQMGVKRIFLLGFDMQIVEGEKHYHREYRKEDRKLTNAEKQSFIKHLKGFPTIQKDAEMLGIKIYNVNPDSVINEFEKITLKEALCK